MTAGTDDVSVGAGRSTANGLVSLNGMVTSHVKTL